MVPVTTYYRAPAGSAPVLLRTDRPGRLARYHWGARLAGPLLTPEACNLDQARVEELPPDFDFTGVRAEALCKRCFGRTA